MNGLGFALRAAQRKYSGNGGFFNSAISLRAAQRKYSCNGGFFNSPILIQETENEEAGLGFFCIANQKNKQSYLIC